uniref:Uncharacterized protein n=1 Tax=Anguilla anguilla TaxID=7936 RepID=A0A0E9PJH9_ANGAN
MLPYCTSGRVMTQNHNLDTLKKSIREGAEHLTVLYNNPCVFENF